MTLELDRPSFVIVSLLIHVQTLIAYLSLVMNA
jgi:hypothetical protein